MAALVALGGTAGASTAVPAPTLKLLAGTGVPGYLGDGGPAVGAQLYQPMGVTVDAAGNVLVADLSNRIRKITPDGIVTTVAGSGIAGFAGDGGPATNAQLNHPTGRDRRLHGRHPDRRSAQLPVRRVDPSGTITTDRGNRISRLRHGDGGPALHAGLNLPTTLALDAKGGILIAEMGERRVRRIDPDGTISTIAGDSGTGLRRRQQAGHRSEPDQAHRPRRHRHGRRPHRRPGRPARPPRRPVGSHPHDRRQRASSHDRRRRPRVGGEPQRPDELARGPLASRARHRRRDRAPACARSSATARSTRSRAAARARPPTGCSRRPRRCPARPAWSIDRSGGVIVASTGLNQLWTLIPARPGS